jgi:plasmid stabilization system protein ParE
LEVVFAPAAVADLVWIRSYIGHFNPSAARRMAERIQTAALSLSEFPDRGRPRPDGARELAVIPPYVLVYDVAPGRVTILRIWHGAQNRI